MKVKDLIEKPVTVTTEASVQECAKVMKKNKTDFLIVLENNKAVGIITTTDIVYRSVSSGDLNLKARDIMSCPLIVVFPDTDIDEAMEAMKNHKIKRLVVIDEKGELKGIVKYI
jgi:IMP dehydrogenase